MSLPCGPRWIDVDVRAGGADGPWWRVADGTGAAGRRGHGRGGLQTARTCSVRVWHAGRSFPRAGPSRREDALTAPRTPKYQAIAAELAARIRGGELAPGSALPPQKELSAAFGVTLATLRQALRQLEDDGLVSQQPGRGTFVAEPRAAYRLDSLRGFAEDLRAQGQTVSTQILGQAVRRPPSWVAARLGGDADRVVRLERLRLLAGRPAVHQLSWIAGVDLADVDLSGTSLYAALADRGIVVHRASEVVRPGVLDAVTADLLGHPEGTPAFVSDRVTFGLDDRALVFDRATILGNILEIRTERAVTGLSMQWSRQT
ncbi:MAG TPA: GntR family transcriptional regulator [Actinoplanes sp.]|nr:GntR family transcriptional regulator [Actinoplanes sp.]